MSQPPVSIATPAVFTGLLYKLLAEDATLAEKISTAETEIEKVDVIVSAATALRYTDVHRAEMIAEIGYQYAAQISYEHGIGRAVQVLAFAQWTRGDYDEALRLYEKALSIFRTLEHLKGVADCLSNIGVLYENRSHYEDAMAYHRQSLELRQELSDRDGIGRCLCNMGVLYDKQADFANALRCYKNALSIFQENGESYAIALLMDNIGIVYTFLGDYQTALTHHLQSLGIRRDIGDERGIAMSLVNTGLVYFHIKQFAEALSLYQQGLEGFERLEDKPGQAHVLGNIGRLYEELKDYSNALKFYEAGLSLAQSLGDAESEATYLCNLGNIEFAEQRYAESEEHYNQALDLREKFGDRRGICESLLNNATLYLSLSKPEVALRLLERGGTLADELELHPRRADAERLLARTYEQLGNTAEALKHYKKYHEIEERIFNEESDRRLKHLQVLHDVEQAKLKERGAIRDKLHGSVLEDIGRIYSLATTLTAAALPEAHQHVLQQLRRTAQTAELSVRRMQWRLSDSVKTLYDIAKHLEKIGRDLFRDASFSALGISTALQEAALQPERIEPLCDLFQLALTNAWKHAAASRITLRFDFNSDSKHLTIVLSDDGKGFEVETISGIGGIGDMHKLAQILGGQLHIRSRLASATDTGFTEVSLTIPVT